MTRTTDIARRAAEKLAGDLGTDLPEEVEIRLRSADGPPRTYVEPTLVIAGASLIVTTVGTAFDIWNALRKKTDKPSVDVAVREIIITLRHEGQPPPQVSDDTLDRIVRTVVEETARSDRLASE
jgi:hypothetical protein